MPANPFALVTPATRGLSLALTRHLLRTTNIPVFATHRSGRAQDIKDHILSPLSNIDPKRLNLLKLELTSESSIKSAASALAEHLSQDASAESYLQTGFFTGGILHPEKQPADLDASSLASTFQVNVISHLLLIKHFYQFLPSAKTGADAPSKWVHITARVGSISDNRLGGWYSYRASKAALNAVVKTFDIQLKMNKKQALCVGIHPGTMKTDLSKDFYKSTPEDRRHEPDEAAELITGVVEGLKEEQRGRIWDWKGDEVLP